MRKAENRETTEKESYNYIDQNDSTCFLIDKFTDITSKRNILLNLPDSMCFSFGLKELISICEISEEINNKSYLTLANSFYDFLKKDFIFKEIDELAYINLIRQLKNIIDNSDKINCSMMKNYFEKTHKIYYKKYISLLQERFKRIIEDGEEIELKKLDFLADILINELLSMGYTYKYLTYIFNYFYFENNVTNVFANLNNLITFLINKSEDTFDMYLPLANTSSRDISFVKNQFLEQEIIKGSDFKTNKYNFDFDNDTYYCHIYFKANDYFRCTEDQLNRVNSIFNFLKFYTNSQVSIDFEGKPFIYSRKLGKISRSSIKSMLQYSYYQGTSNVINAVNKTFAQLSENHNSILTDIYNILNYSQKNHDIFSNDQFLSKWISLESCASKSVNRKGFDAVLEYVTKALSITFYRQKITRILKDQALKCNLDYFVRNYDSSSFDKKISKIKNNYYKYLMREYIEVLSSNSKFANCIDASQNQLKYMLYRIYLMRNKYVHSGNTLNENDMLRYYLNIIEPFFIDKILKTLNLLLAGEVVEYNKVTWNDIYSEIDFKYDSLHNTLWFMKEEKLKQSRTSIINFVDIVDDNNRKILITNILVERSRNLLTIKEKNDYYKDTDDEEFIIDD